MTFSTGTVTASLFENLVLLLVNGGVITKGAFQRVHCLTMISPLSVSPSFRALVD